MCAGVLDHSHKASVQPQSWCLYVQPHSVCAAAKLVLAAFLVTVAVLAVGLVLQDRWVWVGTNPAAMWPHHMLIDLWDDHQQYMVRGPEPDMRGSVTLEAALVNG